MSAKVISDDPLVIEINAENVHCGRLVLTDDGWQTVKGLLAFQDADQVTLFTDERDDLNTDGWRFKFGDKVQVRYPQSEEDERMRLRQAQAEKRRLRDLAAAAANCPAWCVEHYDCAPDEPVKRNHSSGPVTVIGADAETDKPVEFEFWIERRDSRYTGGAETVGVLHTRIHEENIELTPDAMLLLSARLSSLAHRAQLAKGAKR